MDAHLDTWIGTGYNGAKTPQSQIVSFDVFVLHFRDFVY